MAATGSVTVKWNTQKSAAIALYTQTSASQTHQVTAENIYAQNNGGSGTCTATDTQAVTGTVDFGAVTPDGVKYTNCLETNAVEGYVTTNDSAGVNVQVAVTGTPVGYNTAANGSLLCLLPDGTWNTGSPTTYAASVRNAAVAMVSTTACSSGTAITAANTSILNSTVAATQDLNADLQLNLGPNSTVGAVIATLTYTVTPN